MEPDIDAQTLFDIIRFLYDRKIEVVAFHIPPYLIKDLKASYIDHHGFDKKYTDTSCCGVPVLPINNQYLWPHATIIVVGVGRGDRGLYVIPTTAGLWPNDLDEYAKHNLISMKSINFLGGRHEF